MREKNNKGITLIALIVTIIILVILATISINAVFGEGGIIEKVQTAQKLQKLAEEKEKIELAKATVAIANKGKVLANEYVEELIKQGVITAENVKNNADGSVQITTNSGRTLKLEVDEEGNVVAITEVEIKDALTVIIKNVQLTEKTNSIKIDVEVERGEGATYKYYIQKDGEYEQVYKGGETSYPIERLESGTEYWIKVEAINDEGTVFSEILAKTKAIITGEETLADIQKIGEYSDKFAMIEAEVLIDNLGSITVESFIEAVKEDGLVVEENVSINSNNKYELMTKERYVFEVISKSESNIEVNYIGIAEK